MQSLSDCYRLPFQSVFPCPPLRSSSSSSHPPLQFYLDHSAVDWSKLTPKLMQFNDAVAANAAPAVSCKAMTDAEKAVFQAMADVSAGEEDWWEGWQRELAPQEGLPLFLVLHTAHSSFHSCPHDPLPCRLWRTPAATTPPALTGQWFASSHRSCCTGPWRMSSLAWMHSVCSSHTAMVQRQWETS